MEDEPCSIRWQSKGGRLQIIAHRGGAEFSLVCRGIRVMPRGTYDQILNYLQWEFGTGPGLEGAA